MSLFDNMAMNNSKNHKAKKDSKIPYMQSPDKGDGFKEEIAEDVASDAAARTDLYPEFSKNNDRLSKTHFKEEFSEELMKDSTHFGIQSYSKAGVTFEKLSDNQAKVNYSGLLAKSGAQEVTGVYGFGSNQSWEGVSTLTLKKEDEGNFVAVIPVEQGKNINFAFKDASENWDNNSGMNYTFVN